MGFVGRRPRFKSRPQTDPRELPSLHCSRASSEFTSSRTQEKDGGDSQEDQDEEADRASDRAQTPSSTSERQPYHGRALLFRPATEGAARNSRVKVHLWQLQGTSGRKESQLPRADSLPCSFPWDHTHLGAEQSRPAQLPTNTPSTST